MSRSYRRLPDYIRLNWGEHIRIVESGHILQTNRFCRCLKVHTLGRIELSRPSRYYPYRWNRGSRASFKDMSHRRFRTRERNAMIRKDYDLCPRHLREVSDYWAVD